MNQYRCFNSANELRQIGRVILPCYTANGSVIGSAVNRLEGSSDIGSSRPFQDRRLTRCGSLVVRVAVFG